MRTDPNSVQLPGSELPCTQSFMARVHQLLVEGCDARASRSNWDGLT